MAAPSTRASDADTRHRRERSKGRAESSPRTSSRIRLGLHSRKHDAEVEFYAFDMLVSDGEDVRKLPLSMRKTNWPGSWPRRRHPFPFEQGEIGPDLFATPA